jgi:putative membrane protein
MKTIVKLLITALALLAVSYTLPGVTVESIYVALIVAVILGALSLIVRPILILLTLPVNILTFGLFTFIINGFLFWFVSTFIEGFDTDGFWWAVLGALIVSAFAWLGERIMEND